MVVFEAATSLAVSACYNKVASIIYNDKERFMIGLVKFLYLHTMKKMSATFLSFSRLIQGHVWNAMDDGA